MNPVELYRDVCKCVSSAQRNLDLIQESAFGPKLNDHIINALSDLRQATAAMENLNNLARGIKPQNEQVG